MVIMVFVFFSCSNGKGQTDGHKYTNDLIHETSPYLLQHAHNPVNWVAWSPAVLEKAKKENKLVLVSVGYSSCHWCHVMEGETFGDEAVAKLMNEHFINIKVDREERPDVDHVYMTALQLMKGNGGWPLNVIALPNGKPIYGGTYHTKEQWGRVLNEISKLYRENPEKANEYADMVAKGIQEVNLISPSSDLGVLTQEALRKSVANWKPNWDLRWGGNKGGQKFMIPVNLDFLLDYSVLEGDTEVKEFVALTLDKIAMGGVYDPIAGGFYRYSTDPQWKIPHFEKMLYDNAQLLSLYSKGYKVFKAPLFKKTVEETIAFLDREMKNPEGGYYAAIDADSEGEEGKFYVWTEEELKNILGEEFPLFSAYFGVVPANIWEKNAYVLSRTMHDEEFLQKNGIGQDDLEEHLEVWKEKLLRARNERTPPQVDDKIIISWNALLVNGLVDAYHAFGEASYLEKAEEVLGFLKANGLKGDHLIHSYKKGSKTDHGFLEDYAFFANASLKLYGATMDDTYLKFSQKLIQIAQTKFKDDASGMYRYSADEELISKIIKTDDGVLPSPNSVMAENLLTLGHLEYNKEATNKARSMLSSMVPIMEDNTFSYSKWNSLLLKSVYPFFEIAVVGDQANVLLGGLHAENIPNALVVGSPVESDLPLFKGRYDNGGTYIYVCRDHTCKLPVATIKDALEQMEDF